MTNKNRILRYVGLSVLLIGIILNVLMFTLQWWPTYLFFILCGVGIFQLGLSFGLKKISRILQILISVFPFLVGYIYFEINSPSDDLFLIPKGYRGQVLIIYGQEDGQPIEFENGWRVYRIPENGKLKTQFKLKGESIKLSGSSYYFVDPNGKRERIKPHCENCENKDTTRVQVIFGSLGSDFQDFFIDIPNSEFKGRDDNRFKEIE